MLHTLNKDILVKLVYTCQENMKEELKRCQDELEFLREMAYNIDLDHCFHNKCRAMQCSNSKLAIVGYKNCDSMTMCESCENWFCNLHGDDDKCSNCI